MELYQASQQWANRPADEQYNSITAMHTAALHYRDISVERDGVDYSTLRAEAQGREVVLVGKGGIPSNLTHWAFGQLSTRANAPASYLRTLPATLAVQNLNHGLKYRQDDGEKANLLFGGTRDNIRCRAITSEIYERVWNSEITSRMLELEQQGWEPARPDIRVKDDNAALYVSDHDMFGFLRMKNVVLNQPVKSNAGERAPIYKGLIYSNSEIGSGSLFAMSFYYNEMCGNHIIWGASNVVELKARHVGTIRERTKGWDVLIRRYAEMSASADQQSIMKAAVTRIAATKEELLNALFGKRSIGLSRKTIEAAYNACLPEEDGDPLTVWGWVQGATRHSQTVLYQDDRLKLDRAASKVLAMAF